jgi:hypothetical protein
VSKDSRRTPRRGQGYQAMKFVSSTFDTVLNGGEVPCVVWNRQMSQPMVSIFGGAAG